MAQQLVRPAVIFLDLIMPGVDGWEVMALLQLDRRSETIPVVAITSSEPLPEKLQQAGFCALLGSLFCLRTWSAQCRSASMGFAR